MSLKVGMVSLGCPKNQMDAELMLAKVREAGFEITPHSGLADVVIVNTCGFIEDAKKEAIENILEFVQLKKEHQVKKIIVTGCMAQRYQQEIAKEFPECDAVLGLGANGDIVDVIRSVMHGEHVEKFPDRACWKLDGHRLQSTPSFYAYLRVGDGCNNCCTYCAIPAIRGKLQSRDMDGLVEEAKDLAKSGVKELVLVAQDTTLYGQDLYGESRLPELLEELCKIDGLEWIRLLYCYPEHVTDKLLAVMAAQPKIVKYMDLPIQHCSDHVLEAMHRPSREAELRELIGHIRETVPGIVLRTTVMTGFPGETEEDFQKLCQFIQDMKFERLGCFAYSAEEGTVAATMPNQIDEEEKVRRRDIVMQEQQRVAEAYLNAQIGKTLDVLVESYDRYAECWFGRSRADAPEIDDKVFFTCPKGSVHAGDMVRVQITDVMDFDLMGDLCE